jgi:hypothetical protein
MTDNHPFDPYHLENLQREILDLKFLPDDVRDNTLKVLKDLEKHLYVEDVHFTPADLYWSREGSGGSRYNKRSEWNKFQILDLNLAYSYGDKVNRKDGKRYLGLCIQIYPHGKTKRGFRIEMNSVGIRNTLMRFGLPHDEKMLKQLGFKLCREFISWQEANKDGKSHPLLYDSEDKCKREVEKFLRKLGLITD